MELKKPVLRSISDSVLTPDSIMNALFRMDSTAEYYHLQTISFAQHKMLDELHESIEDSKDAICEYLLGVQAPKKFGTLSQNYTETFSDNDLSRFLQQGFDWSIKLCAYAESNKLEQLCNLSSELQGSFAKGKYLNTLK